MKKRFKLFIERLIFALEALVEDDEGDAEAVQK